MTWTPSQCSSVFDFSLLKNKDEYLFNLLFLPGVIDQQTEHNDIISNAIEVCEDRGDVFLVYDNTLKTDTVATAKSNTEARNSSFAAVYYPHVQIQDASLGTFRYVPPSVVIAGVYHFNDTVGQPWFAPAGFNRGALEEAAEASAQDREARRREEEAGTIGKGQGRLPRAQEASE